MYFLHIFAIGYLKDSTFAILRLIQNRVGAYLGRVSDGGGNYKVIKNAVLIRS
jgi:hypothetical protein